MDNRSYRSDSDTSPSGGFIEKKKEIRYSQLKREDVKISLVPIKP